MLPLLRPSATLALTISVTSTVLHHVVCSSSRTPNLDEPFQHDFFHHLSQTPCTTLFTRSSSVGCGTFDRDDAKGTLLHWSTMRDTGEVYGEGDLPSFVAVLEEGEYTQEIVVDMRATGALKGILLLANSTSASASSSSYGSSKLTSPAPPYPRGQDTPSENINPDNAYQWNTYGDSLVLESFYGVPTGYVQNDDDMSAYLQQISVDQALEFLGHTDQATSSRCIYGNTGILESVKGVVARFNLYMGKDDITTDECLAWTNKEGGEWVPMCLPLGGNSVWALAGSPYPNYDDDDGNERHRTRVLEEQANDQDDADDRQAIVMLATNMDSTSMFHEVAPGANTAAANILSLLMAAKLIGESVSDATLDGFQKKIMFSVFQGEQYGFLGSRSFLRDLLLGFTCDDNLHVPATAKDKDDNNDSQKRKMACLNPFRYDMDFTQLGNIDSMIVVDQVGIPTTDSTLYLHADDTEAAGTLSDIITSLSSDTHSVAQGSAGSIPPTPLTTLRQLTDGGTGGVVLSGYDDSFPEGYLSHLDSEAARPVDMGSIAFAATTMARAALAAASGEEDYYAGEVVPELDEGDAEFLELADCLFVDGNCDLLVKYGKMDRQNRKEVKGVDLGIGQYLGKPPNYYTDVYDVQHGQGFVQVDGQWYGSYTGEKYGENDGDAVMVRPSLLEMAIHGLLDEYLGRGSTADDGDEEQEVELKSCSNVGDCSDISYCSSSNGDTAVCSGTKVCVCSRARYHVALDEAIYPAPNNSTSYFLVDENEDGVSAMYSEPMWSNEIGVEVYRDTDKGSGNWMLGFGIVAAGGWAGLTIWIKRKLIGAKLY